MWIEKQYRPELCSAQDDYRPALDYVNVTRFNGMDVAIGADGYICAVVPVNMESDDEPGLIHSSIFKYARKYSVTDGRVAMSLGVYEITFANNWSAPRALSANYDTLKFPDITPIVARPQSDMLPVFGVNPDLLKRAATAIGHDPHQQGLFIHRDGPTAPLVLALEYQSGIPVPPFALVMPLHLSLPDTASRRARAA